MPRVLIQSGVVCVHKTWPPEKAMDFVPQGSSWMITKTDHKPGNLVEYHYLVYSEERIDPLP